MEVSQKSIFQYDNYREFLKDYYAHAKSKNRGFSFRVFSRIAGFKGGNVLKRVMDGDHNLSREGIEKFAKALHLGVEETKFFRSLVQMNQAKSHQDKQFHASQILKMRRYRKAFPLKLIQYELFAKWYLTVILEMVTLAEFKEDPEWIASKIYPEITPAEAKKGIADLMQIGLLKRDANGRLVQGEPIVSSQDGITSSALSSFHREMMARAAESIERVPREHRDLNTFTFSASPETFEKLKELLVNYRKEAMEIISSDSGKRQNVYLLAHYFFPLLPVKKKVES